HHKAGHDGIFKHQAERQKKRSESQAGQHGNKKVRDQITQSRPVEHKIGAGLAKVAVEKGEAEQNRSAEDQGSRNQAGHELRSYQQLAAHRRQEVIMQAFFHDFAAKQPGEQAHAPEEDPHAQVEDLEDVGKDARIFAHIAPAAHRAVQGVDAE